jgi:hypothetical protein
MSNKPEDVVDQLLIRVRRSEQMTRDKREKMAALDIEIERTRARFEKTSLLIQQYLREKMINLARAFENQKPNYEFMKHTISTISLRFLSIILKVLRLRFLYGFLKTIGKGVRYAFLSGFSSFLLLYHVQ